MHDRSERPPEAPGGRDEIVGERDGHIVIRVTAPPVRQGSSGSAVALNGEGSVALRVQSDTCLTWHDGGHLGGSVVVGDWRTEYNTYRPASLEACSRQPTSGVSRQPYYRWRKAPVSNAELDEAHLANAIFDAHRDDPEFGYRFLADEVRQAAAPWAFQLIPGCLGHPVTESRGSPAGHRGELDGPSSNFVQTSVPRATSA